MLNCPGARGNGAQRYGGSDVQKMGIILDTWFFPDSIDPLCYNCQASDLARRSPAEPSGTKDQALGSQELPGSSEPAELAERRGPVLQVEPKRVRELSSLVLHPELPPAGRYPWAGPTTSLGPPKWK